ncbi:MAG: hypothetical protein ACOYXT_03985 [Bacteroidota bacterium]
METTTKFFLTAMIIVCVGVSASAQNRGRGNGNGWDNDKRHRHDRHDHRDRHDNDDSRDRWDYRAGHNRHHDHDHWHRDRHVHHIYRPHHHHIHSRHCGHRVVVYRYERPRYVYYRDYDVYYDCHRSVYITFSGRNWSVSAGIPTVMRHVDLRTATRVDVDYYDDDFISYLDRGEPMYRDVYAIGY